MGEAGQVFREAWAAGGTGGVRVNAPDVADGPYRDRWEAQADGRVELVLNHEPQGIDRAWLCMELWGGHPGTANKRVRINGRGTYALPEVGAAAGHCTYSYPRISISPRDLVRGVNTLQFACDQGTSFWGHYIIRAVGVRLALADEPAAAGHASWNAVHVQAECRGERMLLRVEAPTSLMQAIDRVVYLGRFEGYDENGDGVGDDWHGYTEEGRPTGGVALATSPPFEAMWDVGMTPTQGTVEVCAEIQVAGGDDRIVRTRAVALPMPARDACVTLHPAAGLPVPFWSRAGEARSCTVNLPDDGRRICRAQLHMVVWDGGRGDVARPLSINGVGLATPAWVGAHLPVYSVVEVPADVLRGGENSVTVLSDTVHHGIEVCLPGPALVVRWERAASAMDGSSEASCRCGRGGRPGA